MIPGIASALRILGTLSMWFSGMLFVLGVLHTVTDPWGREDKDDTGGASRGMSQECRPGKTALLVTWAAAAIVFGAGLTMWLIGRMA